MLESSTFVVQEAPTPLPGVRRLDIHEEGTRTRLGFADERCRYSPRLMRWLLGAEPASRTWEVREQPDDSLVFTVRSWRGWFRSHVIVQDAMGELVGRCWWKGARPQSGVLLISKSEKPVARVDGDSTGLAFSFLSEGSGTELGRVAKATSGKTDDSPVDWTLRLNPALAEEPLTKMLLLGATLVVACR